MRSVRERAKGGKGGGRLGNKRASTPHRGIGQGAMTRCGANGVACGHLADNRGCRQREEVGGGVSTVGRALDERVEMTMGKVLTTRNPLERRSRVFRGGINEGTSVPPM